MMTKMTAVMMMMWWWYNSDCALLTAHHTWHMVPNWIESKLFSCYCVAVSQPQLFNVTAQMTDLVLFGNEEKKFKIFESMHM